MDKPQEAGTAATTERGGAEVQGEGVAVAWPQLWPADQMDGDPIETGEELIDAPQLLTS